MNIASKSLSLSSCFVLVASACAMDTQKSCPWLPRIITAHLAPAPQASAFDKMLHDQTQKALAQRTEKDQTPDLDFYKQQISIPFIEMSFQKYAHVPAIYMEKLGSFFKKALELSQHIAREQKQELDYSRMFIPSGKEIEPLVGFLIALQHVPSLKASIMEKHSFRMANDSGDKLTLTSLGDLARQKIDDSQEKFSANYSEDANPVWQMYRSFVVPEMIKAILPTAQVCPQECCGALIGLKLAIEASAPEFTQCMKPALQALDKEIQSIALPQ